MLKRNIDDIATCEYTHSLQQLVNTRPLRQGRNGNSGVWISEYAMTRSMADDAYSQRECTECTNPAEAKSTLKSSVIPSATLPNSTQLLVSDTSSSDAHSCAGYSPSMRRANRSIFLP